MAKQKLKPIIHKPRDLNPDSQLCVRKTFSASFVPQPTENYTLFTVLLGSAGLTKTEHLTFHNFSLNFVLHFFFLSHQAVL